MESKAQRFLREQAGRADGPTRKEPAKGTGVPLARLSQEAFDNAYEAFRDYLAFDAMAPDNHPATVAQFLHDANEFGWLFTDDGDLIEDGKEPA